MARARKPIGVKPPEDWVARDAMHTLMRAEEIKRDPKLMQKVRVHAVQHREALGRIARGPKGTGR